MVKGIAGSPKGGSGGSGSSSWGKNTVMSMSADFRSQKADIRASQQRLRTSGRENDADAYEGSIKAIDYAKGAIGFSGNKKEAVDKLNKRIDELNRDNEVEGTKMRKAKSGSEQHQRSSFNIDYNNSYISQLAYIKRQL